MPVPLGERILLGLFMNVAQPHELLEALDPDRNKKTGLGIEEKMKIAGLELDAIFPWTHQLSNGIDANAFVRSYFEQPDVFIRLRENMEWVVKEKLQKAGIPFREIDMQCIAVDAGVKLDGLLGIDYEAMIQDLSSQRTGDWMQMALHAIPSPFVTAWDCCAASGGKSMMLFDLHEKLDLVVSDVRENILHNLEKRFREHGIHNYEAIVADLSKKPPVFSGTSTFQLIIADVPCSGSGTWGRTPEQLFFFEEEKIYEYASLQRKIMPNVVPQLQPGGFLLYITCSVFKEENEAQVQWLKEKFHLREVKMECIKGYDKKADTMFAALLQKTL